MAVASTQGLMFYFCGYMLSKEEENFIKYWETDRLRRKKLVRKLAMGLPLAVLIVVAILVNLFSGWHKEADMEVRSNGSLILIIIIAAILIVVFITVFSERHKWDINEQRYQELLGRHNKE